MKIFDTMAFNVTMIFLNVCGMVNSIVAMSRTALIGAFGLAGSVLCLGFFGYGAYKACKEGK